MAASRGDVSVQRSHTPRAPRPAEHSGAHRDALTPEWPPSQKNHRDRNAACDWSNSLDFVI